MSSNDERTTQSQADPSINESIPRPRYEAPRIKQMSEKDVLKSFQVTGAAATWWGM